eukprot:TRINITY_DN1851_c0_g1_i2.p1 TRINITY_DN1851_c0_g1~~TRINITY_DN1851_c0_g1_i2.p1  ORF type:complete len:258 (-),score=27.12 TRINITY_DN1851_c0_g1_i2:63-836(-)
MSHSIPTFRTLEYVVVDQSIVALKPKNMTHEEAASVPLAGLTAFQALVDGARVLPGQSVLVLGASGGTGTFVVQLAKHFLSAYVLATCSDANRSYVASLGADEVIDYHSEDCFEILKERKVDVVVDCVGGRDRYDLAAGILRRSGKYVTLNPDPSAHLTLGSALNVAGGIVSCKLKGLIWGPSYIFTAVKPSAPQLNALSELISSGKIKTEIEQVYTLDHLRDAHLKSQEGHVRGKLVIRVSNQVPSTNRTSSDVLF